MTPEQQIKNIENKLDAMTVQLSKLNDAIITMTRIEEHAYSMQKDIDGFGARLSKIEAAQQKLAIQSALNSSKGDLIARWMERIIMYIVLAALASYAFFKSGGST